MTGYRIRVLQSIVGLSLVMTVIPHGIAAPLEDVRIGVILTTAKEDHSFMFGPSIISEEKSKEYLSGLAHDLLFSKELPPAWPEWKFMQISAVYCHAGPEGADAFLSITRELKKIAKCDTLEKLLEKCNCVVLVNTGGKGEANFELVSKCLEAGHPIFVDKFLAATASQAHQLIELAQQKEVPLMSASFLLFSEPGLQVKSKIDDRGLTKVTSTGWDGTNIAGDIHPISHMLMMTGERKPVSVRCEQGDAGWKAIVTFSDGVIGELAPRKPNTVFELYTVSEGATYYAHYENKHTRPSSIITLQHFYDYVRGKGPGVSPMIMESAIAIWEAAGKARETGKTVIIGE
jgi:predicted dehydrogenase